MIPVIFIYFQRDTLINEFILHQAIFDKVQMVWMPDVVFNMWNMKGELYNTIMFYENSVESDWNRSFVDIFPNLS